MSSAMTIVIGSITLVAVYGIVGLSLSIKHVSPGHARNVSRLPLYFSWEERPLRTLGPGWHLVFPGRDHVGDPIDLREQVASFAGQRVLTADHMGVIVDAVLSFQVTEPRAAFEIGDQNKAVERLVPRLLSYIIGGMSVEQTLASRDKINTDLRKRLDDVSGEFGIRVSSADVLSVGLAPDASGSTPSRAPLRRSNLRWRPWLG